MARNLELGLRIIRSRLIIGYIEAVGLTETDGNNSPLRAYFSSTGLTSNRAAVMSGGGVMTSSGNSEISGAGVAMAR